MRMTPRPPLLPKGQRFDFIFGDAFNDFQVPYHLTTKSSTTSSPGIEAERPLPDERHRRVHYDFLRSEIRTLRETFGYVGVISPAKRLAAEVGRQDHVRRRGCAEAPERAVAGRRPAERGRFRGEPRR